MKASHLSLRVNTRPIRSQDLAVSMSWLPFARDAILGMWLMKREHNQSGSSFCCILWTDSQLKFCWKALHFSANIPLINKTPGLSRLGILVVVCTWCHFGHVVTEKGAHILDSSSVLFYERIHNENSADSVFWIYIYTTIYALYLEQEGAKRGRIPCGISFISFWHAKTKIFHH
jgi:hypothetical protein